MAFHDREEERLDRRQLAALQQRKLNDLLAALSNRNRFYHRKLSGLAVGSPEQPLTGWPFTTREEIEADQRANPPYGTNLTAEASRYTRMHQTSGSRGLPVRWLDTPEGWAWCQRCWSIVYRAVGVTERDCLVFPFSFGPFLGFWAAFESAVSLGFRCLAAGGMTTSARLNYLLDHQATVVCCTPTYALRMAEVARTEGIDLAGSPVRALIVAGEPGGSIPATRSRIAAAWGARVIDHTGMTETGPWGFECEEAPDGVHVIESEYIAEVIDPQTGEPVSDGESGELVLTNLGRHDSPLIRYRTGDLVRISREKCACGRWFARCAGGIQGRIDDMMVIRGNNVFPSAVEGIIQTFEQVAEFRMTVDERGTLTELAIEIEPVEGCDVTGLGDTVAAAVQDRLHFRPRVRLVAAGALPRYEMKARRLVRSGAS